MAETTVTFLTYNPATQVYTPELRVFELEISADAQATYIVLMSQLQQAVDAIVSGSSPAADEMVKIAAILRDLETWTKYRYVYQGAEIKTKDSIANPSAPGELIPVEKLGTMDRYMAEAVDKLIRTVRAAGYDPIMQKYLTPDTSLESIATKLFITDASLYGFSDTITTGVGAAQQCRIETNVWTQSESIQQLLMVDYVSRGNELLYAEMAKLKVAIDINQSTLSYLNSLQDLMNQKDPERFIMALQVLSGSVGADATKYADFERETFNQELENVAKFSEDKIEEYLKSILGIPSTVTPKDEQITGTALGAFKAFTEENLDISLNAYLASKGITTATMNDLVPIISDNPNFNERMKVFAETYSLTGDDTELIWRTFLVKEAGITALPSTVDLASSVTVTNFEEFLESIGSQTPTSVNLPGILQSYLNAFIHPRFESILAEDAGVPITEFGTLYPADLTSFDQARAVIDAVFTAFVPSEAEKLNILRAFLVVRGAELSKNPDEIDMTASENLDALLEYAFQVSSDSKVLSAAWLTSLPSFSLSLYEPILQAQFPDSSGFTEADRLNIWKAFLISQGIDSNTSVPTTDSPLRATFLSYVAQIAPLVGTSTGTRLVDVLYNSLYVNSVNNYMTVDELTAMQPTVRSLIDAGIGYPSNATVQSAIINHIDTVFASGASYNLSDEEKLNLWRAFMASERQTDPEYYDDMSKIARFLETGSLFVGFLPQLTRGQFVPNDVHGEELIKVLEYYAWLPPSSLATICDNYIKNRFPVSLGYTAEDKLTVWKAYLISAGISNPLEIDSELDDIPYAQATILQFQAWIQRGNLYSLGNPDPTIALTGDQLVYALQAWLYVSKPNTEAKELSDLSAVTAVPGATAINYSTIIDDTVGFILAPEQKLRVWQAFLAGDAGAADSVAIIDVSSQATIDRFKAYLTSIASSDVGAAIDTRIQRIITNLQYLSNQIAQATESTGSPLQKELDRVRQDFEALLTVDQPIKKWVEDYQEGRVGDYQKHLNDAIVASQALNDTEREELRRVMFVYEEFYKSATAMLSKLTQLIEKMASAISR